MFYLATIKMYYLPLPDHETTFQVVVRGKDPEEAKLAASQWAAGKAHQGWEEESIELEPVEVFA